MATDDLVVNFAFSEHRLNNGDFLVSLFWHNLSWRNYWDCYYCRREVNYLHDPLNKRARFWN